MTTRRRCATPRGLSHTNAPLYPDPNLIPIVATNLTLLLSRALTLQAQAGVAERFSGEARPEMRALLPQVP